MPNDEENVARSPLPKAVAKDPDSLYLAIKEVQPFLASRIDNANNSQEAHELLMSADNPVPKLVTEREEASMKDDDERKEHLEKLIYALSPHTYKRLKEEDERTGRQAIVFVFVVIGLCVLVAIAVANGITGMLEDAGFVDAVKDFQRDYGS